MPLDPDILAAVTRSSANLPADAQVTVAQGSQSMGDAIDAAQAVAAYGDATNQVAHLHSLDSNGQQAAWKSASTAQQSLWVGAGFKDPTNRGRGLFSRAVHDVFGAPAAVLHEATKIPVVGGAIKQFKDETGQALNALGAPLRLTQHLYRTGEMLGDTQDSGSNALLHNPLTNALQGLLGAAVEPGHWADAWDKTTSGEQTFDPNRDRDIQAASGFDDQTIQLAKHAAGGESYLTDFFKHLKDSGMADNDIVDLEDKVNDPTFQKVVQQYKDAKMSFGRSLVPQYVWDHDHAVGTILSGAGDALFSFADPTLVAGKVAKVAKIAKYGFKSAEEIGALLDKPAAAAWIQDVSGYLAKKDYAGLANRHPQLNPVMDVFKQGDITTAAQLKAAMQYKKPSAELLAADKDATDAKTWLNGLLEKMPKDEAGNPIIENGPMGDMVKAAYDRAGLTKVKSEEQLKQWLTDNTLANHIATGHGTAVNHGVQMVPTLTPVGKAALDAKGFGKKLIDMATNVGVDIKEGGAQDITGRTLPKTTVRMLGNTARKFFTLLPDSQSLMVNDPKSVTEIQRFANMYLSAGAADAVVNRWVNAGTDLGLKKNIYTDLLSNTFKAAGIDESSPIYQHYLSGIEKGIRTTVYSAKNNDAMLMPDGTYSTAGLLDHHLTNEWSLPSFRDLAAAQNRNKVMNLVYKTGNNRAVDLFSNVWKPMQLLRVGFPIRVSLEELAGSVAREGPINVAKSFLAARNLKGLATVDGPLQGLNPLEGGVSRLLRELSKSDRDSVKTLADLTAKVHATRAVRALKDARVRIPGLSDLEQTVKNYPELFEKGLPGEISSIHGHMLGYQAQDAAQLVQDGMHEDRLDFAPTMKVAPNGNYKLYTGGDAGFMSAWMKQLDDVASSSNTKIILDNIGDPPEVLRQKVATFLRSADYQDKWRSAARSERLSDGRTVGFDATPHEAALDWADHLISHVENLLPKATELPHRMTGAERNLAVNHFLPTHQDTVKQMTHVTDALESLAKWHAKPADARAAVDLPDHLATVAAKSFKHLPQDVKGFLNVHGRDAEAIRGYYRDLEDAQGNVTQITSDLANDAITNHRERILKDLQANGRISSMNVLHRVDRSIRPTQVSGPEFVQLPGGGAEGMIREMTNRGFSRMGRAIDYMSRQPMYLTAVHKADKDIRPIIENMFGAGSAMSEELTHTLVRERAAAETTAYIHNPRIRSQMNILTQNLMPFQFAQEQFWKRWGRTFVQSPEAMREAELAHHALGATGITHKDGSGQEILTYPATGFVQKVLADGFEAMNIPAAIPVVDSFTGQLKMVAPGLDRTFAPSFGPFVSIPLSTVGRFAKDLQPATDKILGPQASTHSLWEQYVPASVARLVNAAISNDKINPSYANAQSKAIQDLYATHHGLEPNASAKDREDFMRRVKNFTRINMFSRALFGFGAPAAPQSAIGDTKFGQQLRELSDAGLNYSQAMQELVKKDPDMYPYTVFMSQGAGTEPLPATGAAMKMLDNNREFFETFPQAGGFFLPTKTDNDKFSDAAYREQLSEQLRLRRTPDEFLNQLQYAQASADYYDTRDDYNAKVAQLHGAARDQLANQYQNWKTQYLGDHPQFAEMLADATSKTKRAATLDNLQRALNDHRVPDNQQTTDIRDLVDTYADLQQKLSAYKGMTSTNASQQRKLLTAQFVNWAKTTYLPAHDGATDVYNSLLRADLEGEQ